MITVIRAKLDANESPIDIPLAIKEKILAAARDLPFNRYEGPHKEKLRALIAAENGLSPDGVLLGNGSDELIQLLVLTFSGPGKPVVIPTPTFPMYQFVAKQVGSRIINFPLSPPRFSLDVEKLLAVLEGADPEALLFLCRPNNPTGSSIPAGEAEYILQRARGPVVVDEAYAEYSGSSLAHLLPRYENLIILRTFSKAFRLAGLRVGYLLAQPQIVRRLEETILPYNMSLFSLLGAWYLMQHKGELLAPLGEIIAQRQRVAEGLAALPGVTPLPSETNFIFFSLPEPAGPIWEELKRRGILVRYYPDIPELAQYLRVSIGTEEENTLFLSELAAILKARSRKGCSPNR
jgi:histidinol-phosphate aminotransferase